MYGKKTITDKKKKLTFQVFFQNLKYHEIKLTKRVFMIVKSYIKTFYLYLKFNINLSVM